MASEKIDLVSTSDTEDSSDSDDDDLLSAPSLRERMLARVAAEQAIAGGASAGSGEGDALSGEQGWCTTDAAVQVRWLWHSGRQGSAAQWSAYSSVEGKQVEAAYRRFVCADDKRTVASCDIAIGRRAYVIDFERLTQAPAREPERTRKIRREQRSVPRAEVSPVVVPGGARAIPAAVSELGVAVSAAVARGIDVDSVTTQTGAASHSAELTRRREQAQLVDTSSGDDDSTDADIYGPPTDTEPREGAAHRDHSSTFLTRGTRASPTVRPAACKMDETLLLDSPSESNDDGTNSPKKRIKKVQGGARASATSVAGPPEMAAAPSVSRSLASAASEKSLRASRTAATRDRKTRRTTQLRVCLEQSLYDRGDGAALIVQLEQEKSLQPEAWEVLGVDIPVPHAVFFTRLTQAVPYRRAPTGAVDADDDTTGTTIAQALLPRVAVVLPVAAFFALVDAGGLAAMQGHLQAVRNSWKQQQQQPPQQQLSAGGPRNSGAECVVHYILEALPRSEKERGAVLRQHARRPPATGQDGTGGGGRRGTATPSARQRAATLEMVLLWLGVEVANVIVHHTENQSSSVDYVSRLAGKLGVSSDGAAADSGESTARAREQFEAQAAWKPDYAALKLLAPQHACSATHAGSQGQIQQPTTNLHPLMKAYFAVLCAVS